MSDSIDLVVIGGGPGGSAAAIRASQLGLRVALVEAEERLGGTCLNWGCIPTKALLRQAQVLRLLRRAEEFGLTTGDIGHDWERVIARSRGVVEELAGGVSALMKKNRVEVVRGRGRLTPSREVEVVPDDGDPVRLRAERVLLATGGRPASLPGVEIDGERVISSREAMVLPQRPDTLVIIGAGAIGVEFASFYGAFGTEVTLLEAQPQVLPEEDPETAAVLTAALEADGVEVHTGVRVTGVKTPARARRATVAFEGPEGPAEVKGERVLMAVGVTANAGGLGLAALGLRADRGRVPVDDAYQTPVPGVYAIGDLIGPPQLAHAASAEGAAAAEAMAGQGRGRPDPASIPRCIYSDPEVASVGLTQAQAEDRGIEVKVGRFPLTASGRARASGDTAGLIKLVFGARYGDLLGASIAGPEATELIAELGLALTLEATWEELAGTVHAHPTLSEGVMEAAAAAFGRSINI